ncbi:hypothetical protein P9A14_05135 [Gordonia hongkongensis]|uniref:DUF222 domain-containing protein n=1 Tax=Gordonia hongkongensis TaxID=1701090 RepID=A0AAX3TA74_9ACTN|nr:hypothetical protein [Gordonia hongkongensis]QIK49191.1 hypothetical protein G8C36_19625 [Gordonia terrae]WFP25900.1 hypothetical protein P9A14_05135 [Gordonia hongkongensis]
MGASRRGARTFLTSSAIGEAIDIEESIVLTGYAALAESAADFGVTPDLMREVDAAVHRHRAIIARLRLMRTEAVAAEQVSSPHDEALAALGLGGPDGDPIATDVEPSKVVRSYHDGRRPAPVAVAYLLAAAHALTDPTNCGTASPALNLMPPPLHRDRALLEKVLTHAVAMSDPATRAELAAHITAASTAFADAGGVTDRSLSVLRYNPHSLRTSCRSMGLGEVDICIAG